MRIYNDSVGIRRTNDCVIVCAYVLCQEAITPAYVLCLGLDRHTVMIRFSALLPTSAPFSDKRSPLSVVLLISALFQ